MLKSSTVTKESILEVLYQVMDPEIDSVSIVDLGMIEEIIIEEEAVKVHLLPTFLGCPALDIIKGNTKAALENISGVGKTEVDFVFHTPWTSDRITEQGHANLRKFGISPPHYLRKGKIHGRLNVPIADLLIYPWKIYLVQLPAEASYIVKAAKMYLKQ